MANMQTKYYYVLVRSHINGGIVEPGTKVAVLVDVDTWTVGPNLQEITEAEFAPPALKPIEAKEPGAELT